MSDFAMTHVVPSGGLPTWPTPDINSPAGPALDSGLPVHLAETWGAWGRVVCSNGWEAWVQAGRLVPSAAPSGAAPQVAVPAPAPAAMPDASFVPAAEAEQPMAYDDLSAVTQPIMTTPTHDAVTTQPHPVVETAGFVAGAGLAGMAGAAGAADAAAGHAGYAGAPAAQIPQANYAQPTYAQPTYAPPPPAPAGYPQQQPYGSPYPAPQQTYPGYAPAPPARAARTPASGLARIQWIPLLGVVAVAVAAFIPWFGANGTSVNAFHIPASFVYSDQAFSQMTPIGPNLNNAFAYILIAAAVVILAGVLVPHGAWFARLGGVAALGAGIDFAIQLQRALSNVPEHSSVFKYLEAGPYVAAGGGLLVLITMRRTRWART